jgi:ElaB/YqjD/DUF883 family membrane-anchored ribosome-binding protein
VSKNTQEIRDDAKALAEDARALVNATANVAEEKVVEARKRLAAALDSGTHIFKRVKEQAAEGARTVDEAVHQHPYQSIGIALGVGAVLGFLAAHRCCCKGQ